MEQNQNRTIYSHIFNSMFFLTQYSFVFQIIFWNWKHLINNKVQGKKDFWHMILHSYLCNALCKFLTLSWRGPLSYIIYHCRANQWTGFYIITAPVMKELIKIESSKCFSKRYSEIENTCNLSKEEIVLPRDSKELFMEVQIFGFCLKACSFIKKRLQHRCFPVTTYFKKHLRPAAFLPFQWFTVTWA